MCVVSKKGGVVSFGTDEVYLLFVYSSGDGDAFTSSEGNSVIFPDSSAALARFSVDPPPLCVFSLEGSGSLVLPMPSLAPPPATETGFILFPLI